MISVTIEQNGHTVGRLEIGPKNVNWREDNPAQFGARFNDFFDGAFLNVYFNFWKDRPDLLKSDNIKILAEAILRLFPSVVDQTDQETARETIRGGDPEDNIAYSHEHALPGQIFFFNDTHKGRRTAIFDLMLKVAKLEKEMKDLKLSVWLADKRLIIIEHQRFKELDRKMEELDKREKELEIKEQ